MRALQRHSTQMRSRSSFKSLHSPQTTLPQAAHLSAVRRLQNMQGIPGAAANRDARGGVVRARRSGLETLFIIYKDYHGTLCIVKRYYQLFVTLTLAKPNRCRVFHWIW